jgi:putative zinc finger/helix-turn-helix YgiT family protein
VHIDNILEWELNMAERSFSKMCANCRKRAVAITTLKEYHVEVEHDGRRYMVSIENFVVPKCSNCGHIVIDQKAEAQISGGFHKIAGLLTPDEMLRNREHLGLTQVALADALGVSVSTLSRWETGAQVQQRSLDKFLRLYFRVPEVRRILANRDLLQPEAMESREMSNTSLPPPRVFWQKYWADLLASVQQSREWVSILKPEEDTHDSPVLVRSASRKRRISVKIELVQEVDLAEEVSFETLAADSSNELPRSEFVLKCSLASYADPRRHALLRQWVKTASLVQEHDLPDPGPTLLRFEAAECFRADRAERTG